MENPIKIDVLGYHYSRKHPLSGTLDGRDAAPVDILCFFNPIINLQGLINPRWLFWESWSINSMVHMAVEQNVKKILQPGLLAWLMGRKDFLGAKFGRRGLPVFW